MTTRTAAAVLWTYKDPENGKTFYLEEKVVSWHSPWSGKTHTGEKPERYSMSAVTKDMKDDKLSRLWSYDAPEGKVYTEEKMVRPRSPWSGKAFKVEKQERSTITDVAKALKDDGTEEVKTASWKVDAGESDPWKVTAGTLSMQYLHGSLDKTYGAWEKADVYTLLEKMIDVCEGLERSDPPASDTALKMAKDAKKSLKAALTPLKSGMIDISNLFDTVEKLVKKGG